LKLGRAIILLVVVVVIVIVVLYAYESTTAPSVNKAWAAGPNYPLNLNGVVGVGGQQCVNGTTYVYCIGGQDINSGPRDEVYSSAMAAGSSGNLSAWTSDTNVYPVNINGQSCVSYSGFAYCVGGSYDPGGDDVASSYFAPMSGPQIGTWISTTAFPIPVDSQSCVASSGYIYCVAGDNETDATEADATLTNSVYYAQISTSGIGNWTLTTAYPPNVYLPSCFTERGYIYCIGGADQNDNAVGTAYYATLSPSGVGAWTETASYPQAESGLACVISSGDIYCLGGMGAENSYTNAAYYAPISPSGIGAWKRAGDFPRAEQTTCFSLSNDVYCVGGFDSSNGENGAVYYTPLSSFTKQG